jgi:Ca2+/Na+ antiporter
VGLLAVALVAAFALLAVVCDQALAPTLEELSNSLKIPHDVACATFLALGSSAPEIFICVVSVAHDSTESVDLSMGAFMGSALIAFSVIPAACVFVSPEQKLRLSLVTLFRDTIFFGLGLACMMRFARDGSVDLTESGSLLGLFVTYLIAMKLLIPFYEHDDSEHHFLTTTTTGELGGMTTDPEKRSMMLEEEGRRQEYGTVRAGEPSGQQEEEILPKPSLVACVVRSTVPPFHLDEEEVKRRWVLLLCTSLFYVTLLSELCLFLSVALSNLLGLNHHFTGLVLVALGAQVPDLFASMAVAKQGEGPSALSNAIGSQVVNINIGIGLPFFLSNLIRGRPIPLVSENQVFSGALVVASAGVLIMCVLVGRRVLTYRSSFVLFATYILCLSLFASTSGAGKKHTPST